MVRAIMKRIGYKAKSRRHDALVALEAGAPDQPACRHRGQRGRSRMGGTSATGGPRRRVGLHARRRGSGYWIGRAALRAVLREADSAAPRRS